MTTRDLTRAFGWTTQEAFLQQDVQVDLLILLKLFALLSMLFHSVSFACFMSDNIFIFS